MTRYFLLQFIDLIQYHHKIISQPDMELSPLKLPEILVQIIKYLPLKDKLQATRVNHTWHKHTLYTTFEKHKKLLWVIKNGHLSEVERLLQDPHVPVREL